MYTVVILDTADMCTKIHRNKLGRVWFVVLQVVPFLFFQSLDAAIAIHHAHHLSLPDRPEKAELREYACFPERAELARLTQNLAAYSCNLRAFDR